MTTGALATLASRNIAAKPTAYLPVYEHWLKPLRRQPITLLEIGVFQGGSLRMWHKYMPKATIIGLDHAHQQATLQALWPHTRRFYVIEDLVTSYRPDSEWAIGPNTMDGLKKRIDSLVCGQESGALHFYSDPGMVVIER